MAYTNPFPILDYVEPKLFCNRKKETDRLISAYSNGRNITLTSIRRLGKTGLIKHVFHKLKQDKSRDTIRLLYIDILKTENLNDFVATFSNTILKDEKENASWFKKLSKLISGIKAKIVINEDTALPSLEFDYHSVQESEKSLTSIFEYLADQKEEYIIAFDEFQQITRYPEKNIEAILRTHIQHQHKDKFIFSGSSKHILISMFNDYGRAFYQSSEMLSLERLDIDEYSGFIKKHFNTASKEINIGLIKYYVEYLDVHTFYVQYFFNKLYNTTGQVILEDNAKLVFEDILKEKEYVFLNYRNILTKLQFRLIKAIAKEKGVSKPNASEFIKKYDFAQASSVNKTLKSLIDKEMIYFENNTYKVYDVFLQKWLEQN